MNYNEVASQLKAKHPEYANRDNKELVQKYIERFPEKASLIEFDDYTETPKKESSPLISKDITKEDVGNYAKGVAQSLSQGVMWGQAPHVSGVLNETINTPQKLYKAKSLRDIVDTYKSLGKDYIKGREKFKEEQGKFAEENPKPALASEMLGSLGAGGLSLLKGGSGLLRQLARGSLEGGVAGGLYGLSNTKGKGADLKGGAIGTGLGSLLGGSLGVGLPIGLKVAQGTNKLLGTLGRLYGKGVDKVADTVTPVQFIKNPLKDMPVVPEGTKVIDAEVVPTMANEKLINNELRNVTKEALPPSTEAEVVPTSKEIGKEIVPTNRDIVANPKSVEDAYTHGRIRSYLPRQNFVIDDIINDGYVRRELATGVDVGRNFDKYGEDVVNELKKVKKVIKNAENEAYASEGVTDTYLIDGNKFVEDVDNAINKFKKDSRTYKQNEGEADKFMANLREELKKNNGQISFGKLKVLTRDANNSRIKTKRDNSKGDLSSEYDLWSDISRLISKLKKSDAKLKRPTEMYSELSNAIEDLEYGTGIKLDNPRTFARKIFSSARDRADGGIFNQTFDDFAEVMNKYEGTQALGMLPSKIRMAKVSYVLRDAGKDNLLAQEVKSAMTPSSWAKRKLAEKLTGKNISAEDYYKIIAQRLEKGELKPEDFNKTFRRISIKGLSDDEANEMYVKSYLLGNRAGAVPSVLRSFVGSGGLR